MRLHVSAWQRFTKALLPWDQKGACRGRQTGRAKKKIHFKWNWEQMKETEFSTGFTTIMTMACNSYRSFLSITQTFILPLTISGCLEIQRCSVSFRETYALICMQAQRHVNIHKSTQTYTLCLYRSKNTEYKNNNQPYN